MRYRTFPGTDLTLSEIGFGVWTVSTDWWGVTETDLRHSLLRTAFEEHGITHFNTADTYGDGLGETILADVLGDVRDQIAIVTKFGYDLTDHDGRPGHRERKQNFDPAFVRQACEASLKRLNTDRIDLYEAHNIREDDIRRDDLLDELERLREQGKIRYYGVSLGPRIDPDRQKDEGVAAIERDWHSVQMIYNLLEQQLHDPIVDVARESGRVGLMARVPHSSGLLEGNLTADTEFPAWDHRSHRPKEWLIDGLKKVEQLGFLTHDGARTIGQAALKFVLHEPFMISALPNIYNHEQLAEFAATGDVPDLAENELAEIAALYASNFGLTPAEA